MKKIALTFVACVLATTQFALAAPAAQTITLTKGDTLYSLARKHGSTPDAIIKANGIKDPTSLKIGQKLNIPHRSTVSRVTGDTRKKASSPKPKAKKTTNGNTYTFQSGDTLYAVSRKLNISVSQLKAANPHLNPNRIRPGTSLKLKSQSISKAAAKPKAAKKKSQKKTSSPKAKAKRKNSIPPRVPAPQPLADKLPEPKFENRSDAIRSVRVKNELTYGQFAAIHGTSVKALNSLNGLKLTKRQLLASGSELYVPGS